LSISACSLQLLFMDPDAFVGRAFYPRQQL
jgi:hypothetical protein